MQLPSVKFASPPVIETVLSVQFAKVPGMCGAHAGAFWQSVLAPNYSAWKNAKFAEAPRVAETFEDFGPELVMGRLGLAFQTSEDSMRAQIIQAGEERMIQVQDTRFIYNWRKQAGGYPSYSALAPEFHELREKFENFVVSSGLTPIEPNQWEVTYVNHIPKGEMWGSPADWPSIVPGLYAPQAVPNENTRLDTMNAAWRVRLPDNRGRLHLTLQHGRVDKTEVMILQLLARGPIDQKAGLTLSAGLELGHATITQTFRAMTSAKAHIAWGGD